jgi:hypothetical protein
MLYEYAVEPQVLSSWADFRYFADRFGIDHGRLISKYPESWPKLVWEACTESSPINRRRIEEGLNILRNRLLKTKRDYDEKLGWRENAEQAHKSEPFHAIIASSSSDCAETIVAGDLSDDFPLWKVARDGHVPRQAPAMAVLAESLLFHSTEVYFIDQHFGTTSKHGRPLTAFLASARKGKKLSRIEYHLNGSSDRSLFKAGLERQRPHLNLAADESIIFIRWNCIEGAQNLHARYLLTNRGGLHFDYGLDEGDGTTAWARISDELWRQRREQFEPESGCFELADAWKVTRFTVTEVVRKAGKWVDLPPS